MRRYEEDWMTTWRSGDVTGIMNRFGITNIAARILWSRGYRTEEQVASFLYPPANIAWPRLEGTDEFIRVIMEGIAENGKFRVIGDYDVDGVTGTYLMLTAFRMLGADADYRIPDRVADGYGLSEDMVRQAKADGVSTLVTVDNGIAAVKQCALAKELGLRVAVTDHHDPQETLPVADCVIDPKVASGDGHYENLCGAVVAALLADALLATKGMDGYCDRMVEIMALATLCDVMELSGIARDIVRKGLSKPIREWNPGLRALFEANGLSEPVKPYSFGFVLGPCINALGRLETADYGVELLLTDDEEQRRECAGRMVEVNSRRREQSDFYTKEAIRLADEMLSDVASASPVIVLYLPGCHESIAGIVCGKVREAWNRPTFLLTDAAGEEGLLKGSGRSTESFSMIDAMNRHPELFLKYGGHPMAAGLTMRSELVDDLRRVMAEEYKNQEASPRRCRKIDLVVPFAQLNRSVIAEIELMGPFGKGNREPLFANRDVTILGLRRVGSEGQYLSMRLRDSEGTEIRAMCFDDAAGFLTEFRERFGERAFDDTMYGRGSSQMTILYTARENTFRDTVSIEAEIKGYRF